MKLGRLAATRPFGLDTLTAYSTGKLPAPPTSVNAPDVADWQMFGNDTYGDCTLAGAAHLVMAWDAEFSETDQIPSTPSVVETYFTLTGGADAGLNEANVLSVWQRKGLFGDEIVGYAPVEPKNLTELHQAIAFYGGAYLGIMCPQSAQEDFANGQPWTFNPHSPIEGGHAIVAVGYTPSGLLCVSWGQLVEVTYPFLANLLEEAWCILPNQIVEHQGDALGIDLKTLQADLARI